MRKPFDIRIFFLSIVYMVLLSSVVLPHHHQHEIACYAINHFEDEAGGHDHHKEGREDHHHHDHKAGEESGHWISPEYYITSDNGQKIKRVFDFVLPEYGHKHYLNTCTDCDEEKPEITTNDKLFRFLSINNTYTVVVQRNIPLRAPPVCLV